MEPGEYDAEQEVFAFRLSRQEYARLGEIAAYTSVYARWPGADPPRLTVEFVIRCFVAQGIKNARVPVGPSGYTGREEDEG